MAVHEAKGTAVISAGLMELILLVKKLHPCAVVPSRAHSTDAGFDLSAVLEHGSVTIAPGSRATIGTGIAVAIPEGYVGLVAPRSGLAAKHGISITNAPGVVDRGYRGEVKCIIHNLGDDPFIIRTGDRIAQMVVVPFLAATAVETDDLPSADRGDAGFGSTGT